MAIALTEAEIDRASALLEAVRLGGRTLPEIPSHCRPRSLDDAYAVQDRLAARLGWDVGGWFCACTNPQMQRQLGLPGPYCARLFSRLLQASPATVIAADHPPLVLECEFAFTLAGDLPARAAPYQRTEVEDAIALVHPAIELVAGHLDDWPNQDVCSVIADNGTDGALIYGAGRADWRDFDLAEIPVTLTVNGAHQRSGAGRDVMGDPLAALVWLANHRARVGEGLKAGHIHTTGTATAIYWAAAGDNAVADFGPLGAACLKIS
ncbi:MAG: fumarylacetoacetate hydrolase family protein [Alphaproteobacteria bacterium]